MTTLSYKLADGTIVTTLAEARESGQGYTTIFHEDPHGELHPKEPTAREIELREKRIAKLMARFEKAEG